MPNRHWIRSHGQITGATSASPPMDWSGLWAISLGFCAVGLAAFVFFTAGDGAGATFILGGTAALVGLIVRSGARRQE